MIPYEDITLRDWVFYWGHSVLFYKRDGKWIPVRPCTNIPLPPPLGDDTTLERMQAEGCTLSFYPLIPLTDQDTDFHVAPLDPFESDDWITYEPELGYFMINDRLVLLDCAAPRSRHKGLAMSRIRHSPPVEPGVFPKSMRKWLDYGGGSSGLHIEFLAVAVANRLNSPLSCSWRDSIINALGTTNEPCILESSVAFVPDKRRGMGMLLYNGVLIGSITMNGDTLSFKSRGLATPSIEGSVKSWVNSNIEYNYTGGMA